MSFFHSYKTLKEYRKDPLSFIVQKFKEEGDFSRLNIFGKEIFIVSNPDDVVHVLKTNHASYSKGRTTKALQKFLGKGLITNDNMKTWRKQHRLIRPIMNIKSIYDLAPRILEVAEAFMPELERNQSVNSFHEMNRLTWRVILKTLFSQESNPEMEEWLKDILELMEMITKKTRSMIPIPFWIPTKNNRKLKSIIQKFDHYVFNLIKERRNGDRKHDLIQLLIDAKEDGESNMTDLEIRDEVMTFLMAGHETITNSLSWLLIEVAKNKEVYPLLKKEAELFFENRDFSLLSDSPWLSASIDESMRLWPPVWVFMRQAEIEDKIRGVVIPKRGNVVLAPFLTHRDPKLWEDPDKFKPERFFDKKKIHPGAYYPFGLGPRACIGMYFAGMEAKIILASLVRDYEWEIVNPGKQESVAGITLRPKSNTEMKFMRRER